MADVQRKDTAVGSHGVVSILYDGFSNYVTSASQEFDHERLHYGTLVRAKTPTFSTRFSL